MTKPSLDLFPDPGALGFQASWVDIERLALHYPSARDIVALVERGDMTREQGLVTLVWYFASAFSKHFHREVEAARLETLDTMVNEPCGCSTATYVRRRVSRLTCASHQADDAVDPHGPAPKADD